MNRLSMTVADRASFKRISIIVASLFLTVACYLAFIPRANAAACAAPSVDYGSATATIKIDTTATYRIWSRLMTPDTTNNSYLLEVDGNTCYTAGDNASIPANTWTWVDYQNGSTSNKMEQSLSVGNHTIKMIGREAGVKLGRVLFVSDTNCIPTANGDNCATTGDTEVPAVHITAPAANGTVSGTLNVEASASDNIGVSKVEFYVNGALKTALTSAPYNYSWDSKTGSNGPTSLMVKAYDAAGNSNSDSVSVNVSNGDTTPPSVPANVKAQANASNKVTVSWSASTDNTGVAGYWVTRDGQTLSKVTSGTQYVDQTVLPNAQYSYKVSAFDAAGNTSGLSTEAKVTTPNITDTQAPSAPGNVKAAAASSTQINVEWTASTDNVGVAAYDVYRAVNGGSASKVASVTSLSYGDTGLAPSTSYDYYVIARDAASNASQQSAKVTAQTQAAPQPSPGGNVGLGKIYGRVTFDRSRAQNATVSLTVSGLKRIYTTDSHGYYYITNVPAGTYSVKYSAEGSFDKVVTVKVSAGRDKIQDVTLRRR